MKPKFTIGAERLHISEKYISNGHWMLTRDAIKSPMAPKPLSPLLSCLNGTYYNGIKGGRDQETTPDFASIIPIRDGFKPLSDEPTRVKFRYNDEIESYVFACDSFEIGVNPKYVPLLRMGCAHAKDSHSPILILSDKTLNGDLIGLVMPMRLDI